jgi:hypothetical protein
LDGVTVGCRWNETFREKVLDAQSGGWRKSEPNEPEAEHPELVRKAMTTLWSRKKIGAAVSGRLERAKAAGHCSGGWGPVKQITPG